jgi:predicted metalloprotease with PDZ domain
MQDIVAAARQAGERTNTDKLLARIARWTSPAFADRVRKIVVDGATAELPADIAAPCLKLETIEKPQFDLGFDFEKSKEAHRVTGLRPDSAAYAAGVREGQRLRQWSVFWDDVAKPVELAVVENEGDRLIRFYPLGAKRRLPRFTVNQPDACAARL